MPTEELFGSYHFLLEVAGVTAGAFKSVEGLDTETEAGQKIPGRLKRQNVTLKKGHGSGSGSPGLAGYKQIVLHGFEPAQRPLKGWSQGSGGRQPKSGFIPLKDARGNTTARWHFANAWPSKVTGPSAGAVVLAVQSVRRA